MKLKPISLITQKNRLILYFQPKKRKVKYLQSIFRKQENNIDL